MRKLDLTNVQEAGEFKRLPAGAYNCVITAAEDVPNSEYLRIAYDIAEGEFAGYYGEMRSNHPDWKNIGMLYKSYKPAALPMFKRFCSAVSKSNGNYVFDGGAINADEKTLTGKRIGLVLGEEQYYSNSGDLKTRLYVNRECAVADLEAQKVPKLKQTAGAIATPAANAPGPANNWNMAEDTDEEVPWA